MIHDIIFLVLLYIAYSIKHKINILTIYTSQTNKAKVFIFPIKNKFNTRKIIFTKKPPMKPFFSNSIY